jgi:hypothetical protein
MEGFSLDRSREESWRLCQAALRNKVIGQSGPFTDCKRWRHVHVGMGWYGSKFGHLRFNRRFCGSGCGIFVPIPFIVGSTSYIQILIWLYPLVI